MFYVIKVYNPMYLLSNECIVQADTIEHAIEIVKESIGSDNLRIVSSQTLGSYLSYSQYPVCKLN